MLQIIFAIIFLCVYPDLDMYARHVIFSCLKVILDILEKLSKPDVNSLLYEFGFQVWNPTYQKR